MADLVHLRRSTDKQTDTRQRHALATLLAAGAPVYEDPATSSRQLSLDRAGFTTLLHEAAVGDAIRIADAARLFRSVADILALRPVLSRQDPRPPRRLRPGQGGHHRRGVPPRCRRQVPGPTSPGRPQDHPPCPGYRRRPQPARPARRATDRHRPAPTGTGEQHRLPALSPDATLDLPGLLADHLRTTGDEAARQALTSGQTIRRGHGYSVRITAPLALHRAALKQSAALADAGPTERKAHRVHAARVTAVQATRLHPS